MSATAIAAELNRRKVETLRPGSRWHAQTVIRIRRRQGHDSRDITMRSTGQALGVAANKGNADRFAANIIPIIREIQASGVTTLRGVARALNARGVQSRTGVPWSHAAVGNIIKRSMMAAPLATQSEMSE
jgi:Recombinase